MADAYNSEESKEFEYHERLIRYLERRAAEEHQRMLERLERKARMEEDCRKAIKKSKGQERAARSALAGCQEKEQNRLEARRRAAAYDGKIISMCLELLEKHFEQVSTPLFGKKVFLDLAEYDLARSRLECNEKSAEGGYLPSGIVFRIPDQARYVRFFVYWNDSERVDVDLHAHAYRKDGRLVHVGWNSSFKDTGIVFSGDITNSDAAEYIDINLDADLGDVVTELDLYDGKPDFSRIEECYVGMMAVNEIGKDIALYDPKNCFFTHEIRMPVRSMQYGVIDIDDRCVRFSGKGLDSRESMTQKGSLSEKLRRRPPLSLEDYLRFLFMGQDVSVVSCREDADVILTMEKGSEENDVSLVESNFFLVCV